MRKLLVLLSVLSFSANAKALTVQKLFSSLDKKNPRIRSKEQILKASLYELKSSKASFYPKLTLSASAQEFYPQQTLFSKTWQQDYAFSAQLSESLSFSKLLKVKIAEKNLKLNTASLELEKLSVYSEALKALLSLKLYRTLEQVKKDEINSAEKILATTIEKRKLGLAKQTDVLRAKANLESVLSSMQDVKLAAKEAKNSLCLLLNERRVCRISTEDLKLSPEIKVQPLAFYIKLSLSRRPEIKKALFEENISKLNKNLAEAETKPSLEIFATYQREDTKFFPQNNAYAVGVTLNWIPFDFENKYKVLASAYKQKAAELLKKDTVNSVVRQIKDAYQKFLAQRAKLLAAKAQLNYSERLYAQTLNQYSMGVSDIVELMTAFSDYSKARENYFRILSDYNLAYYELLLKSGWFFGGRK